MDDFVPSTPDPTLTALVLVLLRYVAMALAAVGVVHGVASDAVLEPLAAALVGIATVVWAIAEAIRNKRCDHAGSVASARQGVAVQPAK